MKGLEERFAALARELFDVQLDATVLAKLSQFVDLIETWAKKTNLVSASSRHEIFDRHLLDSLAPAVLLKEVRTLADFGSGAGFPGIPLAVLQTETRIDLIEVRRRRANFLRHVVRSLGLTNAVVHETRVEDWRPPHELEAVVGRALRTDTLASLAAGVLSRSGLLIAMTKAETTPNALPGFVLDATVDYALPGGRRHQVVRYRRVAD